MHKVHRPLEGMCSLKHVLYHMSILRGADDAESVGQVIWGKADELQATTHVMAAHNKPPP